MALNVIILGPPGAGKGTQAERFAQDHGIPRISTGDILRDAVQARTEIGERAKALMARGELVSDDVMIGIVRDRIDRSDAKQGFVLEGFPRTVAQAAALDAIMNLRDPLIVIDINVPENELIRRLGSRLICRNCGTTATPSEASTGCLRCGGALVQRVDDTDEIVRERLKVYHRQSEPLVEYYRVRPTFRSVNGAQPPDRVATDLAAAVAAALKRGVAAQGRSDGRSDVTGARS